ncbi:hypothetical protein NUBL21973_40710 [Klebsiella pneumoniae]|jgi:transposase InsO family protein|nr:hypothetical protein NUBL21973_40710 [Klebsiella pneumoniae]GKL50848.1 hypothetical protein NUBL21992_45420 [Klebsiella pneumoniae]GKM55914.1 hypothetical protein NUBL13939_40970 [Klebsiella pneumoniae]GKP38847.1 hypothetical protein NUBL515_43000 [Klebsiella pneumoniae]
MWSAQWKRYGGLISDSRYVFRTDNGNEFISKSLDKWAYEHGVTMDFSRPGKMDNPFIESFNGSLVPAAGRCA